MNRLCSVALTFAFMALLAAPADACWWWHHRCCGYGYGGTGQGVAYGTVAPMGATNQGFVADQMGSMFSQWLRQQIATMVLNPGGGGSQGVESQLAAINTTLETMSGKLDKLDTIAEALGKKPVIGPMPAEPTQPGPTTPPSTRPITPPPQGAVRPAQADLNSLAVELRKINDRLNKMQGEIDALRAPAAGAPSGPKLAAPAAKTAP